MDCIAVIEEDQKKVGSTEGHAASSSSPFQAARVADSDRRLDICRNAIMKKDFQALSEIIELDSNMMHAVMMTSNPPLFYWKPATLEVMASVQAWRKTGLPAAYTMDAGANVHVICEADKAGVIQRRLSSLPGVKQVIVSVVGGAAHLL
jgi:diphosphomevalonate decarboxylase